MSAIPPSLNPYERADYPTGGLGLLHRAQIAKQLEAPRMSPVEAARLKREKGKLPFFLPSFWGKESAVSIMGRTASVTGALGDAIITGWDGDEKIFGDAIDPDWNVWDEVTPELIEEYPFIMEDSASGRLGDIPTKRAFAAYLMQKDERIRAYASLSELGLFKQLGATLVGQVPDILTGYSLVRALGVGGKLGLAALGARGAGISKQVALAGQTFRASKALRIGSFGAVNAFQELGIQWADPDKKVALDGQVVFSALAGLLIGGMVEGTVALFPKGATLGDVRRTNQLAGETRRYMKEEPVPDLDAADRLSELALEDILKEPVLGPRTIMVVDTPKAKALAKKIEDKYKEADQQLMVQEDLSQEYKDMTRRLQEMDRARMTIEALDYLIEGKTPAARAASKLRLRAANRYRMMLDRITPGGALKSKGSDLAERAHRTLFNESQATVGAMRDPSRNITPTPGEALRSNYTTERLAFVDTLQKNFDGHFKSKRGPITYVMGGGETLIIKSRWDQAKFKRAVTDYQRRMEEFDRGQTSSVPEVPAALKESEKAWSKLNQTRADQLYQVRLMEVSPQALEDLRLRLAESKRLLGRVDEFASRMEPGEEAALESIRLAEVDHIGMLIERFGKELRFSRQRSRLQRDLESAKRATKVLHRERQALAEEEVMSGRSLPEDINRLENQIEMIRSLRRSRERELNGMDSMERGKIDASALEEELSSLNSTLDDLKKPTAETYSEARRRNRIKLLEKSKKRLEREVKSQTRQAKALALAVKNQEHWSNRIWITPKIIDNRPRFAAMLKEDWDHFRVVDYYTGKEIDPDSRVLMPEIYSRMTNFDLKEMARRAGIDDPSELTEGQLRAAYKDNYDEYIEKAVEYRNFLVKVTVDDMTGMGGHGVEAGFSGTNALKSRKLPINETRYREFLIDDSELLSASYDNQLIGKIALRRAIQLDRDFWEPLTRSHLEEDLSLDPLQIVRVMDRDFQDTVDLAVNQKDKDFVAQVRNDTTEIFKRKIEEIEGRTFFFGNPAKTAGFMQWFARNALRGPALAWMGRLVVSSYPDVSNNLMYTQHTAVKGQVISGIIRQMVGLDHRGMGGLKVSYEEGASRWLNFMEMRDIPITTYWGRGVKGWSLSKADMLADKATKFLFASTGMNRWNTGNKIIAARMISWVIYSGAQRMSKAIKLIDGGMKERKAFHMAGLPYEDAVRLNRLGIHRGNVDLILDQFRIHGRDIDGKTLTDKTESLVHPNFSDWDNPGLIEVMTATVNAEVDNIIVTPNALSKPLLHNDPRFGLPMRLFNQFSNFGMAQGNQLAPMLAQRSGWSNMQYLSTIVLQGAMVDAVVNDISGRRSYEETANLWLDPKHAMGMVYQSSVRAGIAGWLTRPLNFADEIGVGPGGYLGANVSAHRAAQTLSIRGNLGPFFDWSDRLTQGLLLPLLPGRKYDLRAFHNISKTAPFANAIWVDGVYRGTKALGIPNPFGPGTGIHLSPFPTLPAWEHEQSLKKQRPPVP